MAGVALYLVSTLGGYLLTSALLLKCPGLLHRPKRQRFRCRHISHRGEFCHLLTHPWALFMALVCPTLMFSEVECEMKISRCGHFGSVPSMAGKEVFAFVWTFGYIADIPSAGENLENTMAAFRHAVNVGTDMLELDCHLTKDEQVVVSHDENLKRATGVDVSISDLKYSELPPYLCKLDVTFQKECHCEGEDNRIPLLKEVFEAFPHIPVNIDIKVNNNVLIKKVSELVSQYKREHLTVWGNVNYEIVEKCHKENADIPILFCLKRVLLLVGLFYTGLLPFIPIREEFLEIPMPSIILKLKEPEKMTRSQKIVIWLADILLMRKALFDHLTARGIQVYIWVLNEEQEYKRAFDLGATGVMTDYPTKLKEFLHNYSA